MQSAGEMNRSFALLRMTRNRNPAILSKAKDLNIALSNRVMPIPQLSAKNQKKDRPEAVLFSQDQRFVPIRNRAMVPGPEWAPITGPT